MRLARVLGAFGRALISAGVIVLLFVAYQLWGTGLQHSQAQGGLEDEFEQFLALAETVQPEAQLASADAPESDNADEPADDDQPSDDAAASDDDEAATADDPSGVTAEPEPEPEPEIEYSQEFLDLVYPEEGATLARITMADIDVDQFVVSGVSVEDLRKGPGHYPSTPNPGMAGNASIAGHRTTYGAPFHRIDELQPGDEIVVQTIQGTFVYRVMGNSPNPDPDAPDPCRLDIDAAIASGINCLGHFIVDPSATWVLNQREGENILTLTACHPKYSARQRIIVQAELVGEPAPTVPRDETTNFNPGPITIDAGAEDEARGDERADEAEETPEDLQQVISDEVAADDDPSLLDDADADDESGADEVADEAPATDDAEADEAAAATGDDTGEQAPTQVTIDEAEAIGTPPSAESVELTASEGPISDDGWGEGLNGDRTKIRPAIMWGIAGGFIWLAAWFIGMRLNRKWTFYLIGVVPFAPVLWSMFVNIDQALPSY